jgi:hypothetical protein
MAITITTVFSNGFASFNLMFKLIFLFLIGLGLSDDLDFFSLDIELVNRRF